MLIENKQFGDTFLDKLFDWLDGDKQLYATSEEESVHRAISLLLSHNSSTIHTNTLTENFVIDNKRLHLTVYIYGQSKVVRIINTKTRNDYKFRKKFMVELMNLVINKENEILATIESAVNQRTQKITDAVIAMIEKDVEKQTKLAENE
jgi:hypothetical protein